MKETIIINIGNAIIHITEEAYAILKVYLAEIKNHFSGNADNLEIITDIENRLAEMMQETLEREAKQVVELADVQFITARMGSVKDFTGEDSEPEGPQAPNWQDFNYGKKLFRDLDNAVLAGVCAGLSHYFGIDARWIRLCFFLLLFCGGVGALLYIICWVAIPGALSRTEKVFMMGNTPNLSSFVNSFEQELKRSANGGKHFLREGFELLGNLIKELFRIFGKAIAACMLLFGVGGLIALVVMLGLLLGFWIDNPFNVFPLSVVPEGIRSELVLSTFILFLIPLIGLILFSVGVLFNRKTSPKTLSFSLLVIWLFGVAGVCYYGAKITSEFQEHAELEKRIALPEKHVYYLQTDETFGYSAEDSLALGLEKNSLDGRVVIDDDDDHPFRTPRRINFGIEPSEGNEAYLVQTFEAQGKTYKMALENARQIRYQFVQKDSLITFANRFILPHNTIWRAQSMRAILKLPIGAHLYFKDDAFDGMRAYYFGCEHQEGGNQQALWIMTEEGLKCEADFEEYMKNKEEQRLQERNDHSIGK